MFFVVLVFYQHESFKHKIFSLLSLLSGFFIIVSSGTRSAWLTFLLLLGFYLYFLFKQKFWLVTKISKITVVLLITSVLFFGSLNQYVNDRAHLAYTQTSNWFSGDKTPSSVGNRLEMYWMAINNVKDVPFFGHGYRTSNLVLYKKASSAIEKNTLLYNHLHNAYLTNFYNGGIVLLSTLLLLLFVPFRIFIKAMRHNRDEPVFIAGVLLTLGYASHGMFSILLGDVFMNAFYVFFLAIFLPLTVKLTVIRFNQLERYDLLN
jgi:O-antigen ligase